MIHNNVSIWFTIKDVTSHCNLGNVCARLVAWNIYRDKIM